MRPVWSSVQTPPAAERPTACFPRGGPSLFTTSLLARRGATQTRRRSLPPKGSRLPWRARPQRAAAAAPPPAPRRRGTASRAWVRRPPGSSSHPGVPNLRVGPHWRSPDLHMRLLEIIGVFKFQVNSNGYSRGVFHQPV